MGRSVYVPHDALMVAYEDWEDDAGYTEGYDDYVDRVVERLQYAFPSLRPYHGWVGREGRIILRNHACEFGISEYCGLMSIWVRLRDEFDYPALALHWVKLAGPRFNETVGNLRLVGTFSNGESIYERITRCA